MDAIVETLQYVIAPVVGMLVFVIVFGKMNQLLFSINPAIVLMLDFIIIAVIVVSGYSIVDRRLRNP